MDFNKTDYSSLRKIMEFFPRLSGYKQYKSKMGLYFSSPLFQILILFTSKL